MREPRVGARMSDVHLQVIARRRGRQDETREQQIRRAEARRLAVAIREATSALAANKKQLAELVTSFAPGLLDRLGVGPAQRRPGHRVLLACRPVPQRRRVCRAGRGQPDAGQQRPDVRHRLNRGGDRNSTGPCTTS